MNYNSTPDCLYCGEIILSRHEQNIDHSAHLPCGNEADRRRKNKLCIRCAEKCHLASEYCERHWNSISYAFVKTLVII